MEDFLICGNPVNPKVVILVEKRWFFQEVMKNFDFSSNLIVCSLGIPSSKCLNFVKKISTGKFVYFGDLDPESLFTYLMFLHLKRKPKPKERIKLNVKYAGITLLDYKKYLSSKVLIKLSSKEKAILDFISKFKLPRLENELKFLMKKGMKIEIEAIRFYGIRKYLKNKVIKFC